MVDALRLSTLLPSSVLEMVDALRLSTLLPSFVPEMVDALRLSTLLPAEMVDALRLSTLLLCRDDAFKCLRFFGVLATVGGLTLEKLRWL